MVRSERGEGSKRERESNGGMREGRELVVWLD